MTKIVSNKALDKNKHRRSFSSYYKARNAWQEVIAAYRNKYSDAMVVLPAYIGFSVNDGSGIYDPVTNLNAAHCFYGLDKKLRIDIEDFKSVVKSHKHPIVLLAHYFGFPDERYDEITDWLDTHNIFYVEDSAHAMLTDYIGGVCGRKGAYNIYSLHKVLPYSEGGMLVDNHKASSLDISQNEYLNVADVFSYDLKTLYDTWRSNYQFLVNELKDVKGITILYPELKDGVCPQSLPVLLDDYDRNDVYFKMNELGFGLVSLYHTMIDVLKNTPYESTTYTANHIINFPVHQDCTKENLLKLVTAFKSI